MLYRIVIILCCVVVKECIALNATFCGKYSCPSFTIDFEKEGYERRFYTSAVWVGTSSSGGYDQATNANYKKLKDYLNGNNVDNKKIPMGIPVVTMMFPIGGLKVLDNFTTFFFIQPSSTPAPAPNDRSVFIREVEPKHMYICEAPSNISTVAEWVTEANNLSRAINETVINEPSNAPKYYSSFFFTAHYNGPHRNDQYKELWFYAF